MTRTESNPNAENYQKTMSKRFDDNAEPRTELLDHTPNEKTDVHPVDGYRGTCPHCGEPWQVFAGTDEAFQCGNCRTTIRIIPAKAKMVPCSHWQWNVQHVNKAPPDFDGDEEPEPVSVVTKCAGCGVTRIELVSEHDVREGARAAHAVREALTGDTA